MSDNGNNDIKGVFVREYAPDGRVYAINGPFETMEQAMDEYVNNVLGSIGRYDIVEGTFTPGDVLGISEDMEHDNE